MEWIRRPPLVSLFVRVQFCLDKKKKGTKMKKYYLALLILGLLFTQIIPAQNNIGDSQNHTTKKQKNEKWGLVRYAHEKVKIYDSRNSNSEIVDYIEKNQPVKVDFLSDNWFAVFDVSERHRHENNSIGYIHSSYLYPAPLGEVKQELKSSLLPYKIVKKEDQSYQGKSRMTYRVLVDVKSKPTEDELKEIAHEIWKNGNQSWGEFTVFLYLPDMNTNSMAYGISNYTRTRFLDFKIQEYSLWGTKWE